MGGLDVLGELLLERGDLGRVQLVEVATDTAVDDGNLSKEDIEACSQKIYKI